MKRKTLPSLSRPLAQLFVIICATSLSSLLSLESAKAQGVISQDQTPTDAHLNIEGSSIVNGSLAVDSICLKNNSTLTIDGTLMVKNILAATSNTTMILCPNAIVDLEGLTLTVSSITLASGKVISRNTIYSKILTLSNGSRILHGTIIIDPTTGNAPHLIETNEHSSDQTPEQGAPAP